MNGQDLMTGEGEEVGYGRDKGLSAVGDGGKAAMSLTSDTDGTHTCIFENSQLEGSYVGDLAYPEWCWGKLYKIITNKSRWNPKNLFK